MPIESGEPWANKEFIRTEGYKKRLEQDRKASQVSADRQARSDKIAADAFERLKKLPKKNETGADTEPQQQNLLD